MNDQPATTIDGKKPAPILIWPDLPWLWAAFSTRIGGVSTAYQSYPGELNLGYTSADTQENVAENRHRLVNSITGNPSTPLTTVRQTHSATAIPVSAPFPPARIPEADALLTAQPGLLIGIQTADCLPILIADPVHLAVAAIHAGWRGTVAGIVQNTISQMTTHFHSHPADLIAAIGPSIGPCCYTVGPDLRTRFEATFPYAAELFSHFSSAHSHQLNLQQANRRQLIDAGLPGTSISLVGGCTACQPELFYSHRASAGNAGRMMAIIGIRPSPEFRP